MKILVATGLYPPESGGPATYSKLLEDRLPALGIQAEVIKFHDVRHLPSGIRHIAYFLNCLERSASCDIIYAQDTVSVGLPAALAALFTGKRFVVRVPGDYAWEQARQRFGVADELDAFQEKKYGRRVERLRSIQRFVVNRACAVIVPSDYMKKIVQTWADPKKVHRIYSSIALPPEYDLPKERPEGFLVLSIARPVPWKGLDGLKRAVEREPWHLEIKNDLPHAQAMGWIKAANVFVINSTYEGLSYLLVEAMALGTPVVATRVGGNPELIEDGVEGLLIPPGDDDALHDALKKIHDNPATAKERAARALGKIKQFDIDVALRELIAIFKTL